MTYRPIGIVPLRNHGAASYRTTCPRFVASSRREEKPAGSRLLRRGRVSIHGGNQRTPANLLRAYSCGTVGPGSVSLERGVAREFVRANPLRAEPDAIDAVISISMLLFVQYAEIGESFSR